MATHAGALGALLSPQTIAVVGASASPSKAGAQMLRSLDGFAGSLFPINPREETIGGRPAYPRLVDVPTRVDLAIVVVPPQASVAALEDAATAGVGAALLCSGGFAETGPDGAELQARAAAIARDGGVRLLGPNTAGFVNPAEGVFATFLPTLRSVDPGPISVVAQSGGVMGALAFMLSAQSAGLRLGVGLGNAADVGFADLLDHLAADDGTRAIALAVEGTSDGRGLFEAVARVTATKPVVALKAGSADVGDFARSHTGALIGSWALARAALHQAGAVVVDDTTELVDAVRALASERLTPSAQPGIGVVTAQAGPGLLIEEQLRRRGVRLPALSPATAKRVAAVLPPLTYQRNPVDTGRPGPGFAEVVRAVAADSEVDGLVVYAVDEPAALDLSAAVADVAAPLVLGTGGPAETVATLRSTAAVCVFDAPERAARAACALVADARGADRAQHPRRSAASTVASVEPPLDEHAAKALLGELGIRVPRGMPCSTLAEARAARDRLSGAVVVKVLNASVTHKSDAGGVQLDIRRDEELVAAVEAIHAAFGAVDLLVEEQVAPGVELIVGGSCDPSFGPSVLVGLGGVAAEGLADTAVRLAPLTELDAHEMIAELMAQSLLDGHRSLPPVDREQLARVIVKIGDLLDAQPAIGELDINPLRATADGLVALDALVLPAAG